MDFPTQNGIIGAAGGLALGLVDFAILRRVFDRIGGDGATARAAGMSRDAREMVMKLVGIMSFLAMPVVGYFVGELVLG